jgi:hypothetical protein
VGLETGAEPWRSICDGCGRVDVWNDDAPVAVREVDMVMWPPGAPFGDRTPWAELWLCADCEPIVAAIFERLGYLSPSPGLSIGGR